ncbi:hypothetical protein BJV82DRAFT_673708 [Fennellomyces sp. T-0311]|nr:hypothetical protein BJV82DRAFT_673708 [Fennellomyces sp. T-0311]
MKLSLSFGILALFIAVVAADDWEDEAAYVGGNNNEGGVDGFVNNFFKGGFLSGNNKNALANVYFEDDD